MKIIEIENSRIAKLLNASITLYPFILYDGIPSKQTRKHESVHIEQIRKIGVFTFYKLYLMYYIGYRFAGLNHNRAYMKIPFEQEAYARENEE